MDLDLNVSAKLGVTWLINTRMMLRSRPNLGLDLLYFSFV